MDIAIILLLLIAGLGLIIVELFLIPGISIAGICGIISLGGSVYAAYTYLGALAGHITLFSALIIVTIGVYWFMKARTLDKMSLKTNINSKINLVNDQVTIGTEGVTSSRLAPMGKVLINGVNYECKSMEGFIEEGSKVKVTNIDGNILQVTNIE